jgi:hypothetical protein
MWTARASIVGLLVLAGCGERPGPHDINDWLPVLAVHRPVGFVPLEQTTVETSCLRAPGVETIGDVDKVLFDQLVSVVKPHARNDAIILVRVRGRYAEVWTGRRCHDPAGGSGDTYLLRRDEGKWLLKETTQWVQ